MDIEQLLANKCPCILSSTPILQAQARQIKGLQSAYEHADRSSSMELLPACS